MRSGSRTVQSLGALKAFGAIMKKTQQEILLEALKQGSVNSYYATYFLKIKQAPTRIRELKDLGYAIVSINKPDRSVDWILSATPKFVVKEYSNYDKGHYCFQGDMGGWRNYTEAQCQVCNPQPVQEALI